MDEHGQHTVPGDSAEGSSHERTVGTQRTTGKLHGSSPDFRKRAYNADQGHDEGLVNSPDDDNTRLTYGEASEVFL